MRYYPAFLDLAGRMCLVIGGGPVAEGKVRGLLEADASVTVVARSLTDALAAQRDAGRIRHERRTFAACDVAVAPRPALVVAATDDPATNARIADAARAAGVLVNVVDDRPRCDFIAPSVVRRGDLCVAISTGGAAPALAVRLRERIEVIVGDEHAKFLALAASIRAPLAQLVPDLVERRNRWYRLVDSDVFELLASGDEVAARERFERIMGVAPAESEAA